MADVKEMLCKALEMAEKSVEFYAGAQTRCESDLGEEVFGQLKSEAGKQLEMVKSIHASVMKGTEFEAACTLEDEDVKDMASVFRELVKKHDEPGTCTTEIGALATASDMTEACIGFYEDWLENAGSGIEKEFVERMIAEQRGQFLLIKDAQYYYEDPEGWAREGSLDGA